MNPIPSPSLLNPEKSRTRVDELALGVHPNTPITVGVADSSEGIIPLPYSDEAINRAIAAFQDELVEWKSGATELSPIVKNMREWSDDLWPRFVPASWNGKDIHQPPLLLRFSAEHARVLGHYVPDRNDTGLLWEISINPRHLPLIAEVVLASTVLHELLHCFEDLAGTAPKSKNNYHSAWFRRTAEELGIPCTRYGGDLGIRDPSPFMDWARQCGLQTTNRRVAVPAHGSDEGSSQPATPVTLPKRRVWTCRCATGVRVSVLVARGAELAARCERCNPMFRRRDTDDSHLLRKDAT